jgi:hypothetical protein
VVLAVQPLIQEEVATLLEVQAAVATHEALRVVELVPCLDNGAPVEGEQRGRLWVTGGFLSISPSRALGSMPGTPWGEYSHNPVATACALRQPLQATQWSTQLAGCRLEIPGATKTRPLP